MRPSRRLHTQEWFIFVCFMVLGFLILPAIISITLSGTSPLPFIEIIRGYYGGLAAKLSTMEVAAAWTISLGPYAVYLCTKPILWTFRFLKVFVVNVIPGAESD